MKSSRSSLFLMELIIAILFFSLASAACIQLFVKAHVLDIRTREQNQTVIWSQNLASLWQANEGDLNTVYEQLMADFSNNRLAFEVSSDQKSLTVKFNSDFQLLEDDMIYYQINLSNLTSDSENRLLHAEMIFYRQDESIYSLSLDHYTASERGQLNE